jgi:cytochrome c oxidase cbb3-type subunit IV
MTLESLYPLLASLWVVWFTALFVGIVAWALWPSRRSQLEDHGRIPLRTRK